MLLAIWVAAWIYTAGHLRRTASLSRLVPAPRPELALCRVPGGVARRFTPPSLMMVMPARWTPEGRYLLYSGAPQPSLRQVFSLSSQANPFAVQRSNQAMLRTAYQWFRPRLYLFDAQTGTTRELKLNTSLSTLPGGRCTLAPGARALTVELVDLSQATDFAEADEQAALYWAPLDRAGVAGPFKRLGPGGGLRWHPSGTGLLYYTAKDKTTRGTYWVDLRTGKQRLLARSSLLSNMAWTADGRGIYCRRSAPRPNPLGEKWALVHVALATGRQTQVPLSLSSDRSARLQPGERPLVVTGTSAQAASATSLAAVNHRTGRVRWLRRDLKGEGSAPTVLLNGTVLALTFASGEDADDSQAHVPSFFSLRDAKLRRPEFTDFALLRPTYWWGQPHGRGLVFLTRGGAPLGLNPFRALGESLWLETLTRPEELLQGPGE